jgi:hypothetical protein
MRYGKYQWNMKNIRSTKFWSQNLNSTDLLEGLEIRDNIRIDHNYWGIRMRTGFIWLRTGMWLALLLGEERSGSITPEEFLY